MAASQKVVSIHVGDGAGGGNVHVSANQNGADGRARLDGFRLPRVGDGTGAHYWNDSRGGELRGKALHRVFGESVEDQGRFDGLKIVGEALSAGIGTRHSGQSGASGFVWGTRSR